MDFQTRKIYYNRCDPGESLGPDDLRNLDFDALENQEVRGGAWVQEMSYRIALSEKPACLYFTGLRGSGKSTEIKRLAGRLSSELQILPVVVDADEVIELSLPLGVPDVLFAIVHAAEAAVLAAEGKPRTEAMKDGILTRIWSYLSNTEVVLKEAEFQIPETASLTLEMKTRETLRQKVRQAVDKNLSTVLKQIREELGRLDKRARALRASSGGLAIIVDSLEKLAGTTSNFHDVLQSAEVYFRPGSPWLQLPVHLLYTVPPALLTKLLNTEIVFMPMIKVVDRAGEPFEDGVMAARELVRLRIPDPVLQDLLGEDYEARVGKLIAWSGGYPRELIRMLRECLGINQSPLAQSRFDQVFADVQNDYRRVVTAEDFGWLARVAHDRYLTIQNDAHRLSAERILSVNGVMLYKNETDWYDLHPAVSAIPGVRAAIEALRPKGAEHAAQGPQEAR